MVRSHTAYPKDTRRNAARPFFPIRLLNLHPVHTAALDISMYEFNVQLRVSLKKEVYAREPPCRTARLRGVEFHQSRAAMAERWAPLLRESDLCQVISLSFSLGTARSQRARCDRHNNTNVVRKALELYIRLRRGDPNRSPDSRENLPPRLFLRLIGRSRGGRTRGRDVKRTP